MEIFLTIFSGVTIFVAGQFIIKIYIEPVQKLKSCVADVVYFLMNRYVVLLYPDNHDKGLVENTYNRARDLGASLNSIVSIIPHYNRIRKLISSPSKKNIQNSADELFGISNQMYSKSDSRFEKLRSQIESICTNLGVDLPQNWPGNETK